MNRYFLLAHVCRRLPVPLRSFHSRPFIPRKHRITPSLCGAIFLGASAAGVYAFTVPAGTLFGDSDAAKLNSEPDNTDGLHDFRHPYLGPNITPDYIRSAATSYFPNDLGVARYDSVVIPSSMPCEDYISTAFVHLPSDHTWSIFAIFDGRSGPYTSAWIADNLIPSVVGSMADLFSAQPELPEMSASTPPSQDHTALGDDMAAAPVRDFGPDLAPPPSKDIDETLKAAFTRVDDDIVRLALEQVLSPADLPGSPRTRTSRARAQSLLAPAYAEASAILAFYDSASQVLRVARTAAAPAPGHLKDSGNTLPGVGAILGRRARDSQGRYVRNKDDRIVYEMHSLSAEPEHATKRQRVFGNGPLKWSDDEQHALYHSYLGDKPTTSSSSNSCIYTAEPEICSLDIQPGDFLVVGSSGFWECLSGNEAVGLVSMWLQHPMPRTISKLDPASNLDEEHSTLETTPISLEDLPVSQPSRTILWTGASGDSSARILGDIESASSSGLTPWETPKRFALAGVDIGNVASHLVRNALGGADTDLTASLLAISPPRAEKFRQDISVTVIFFREDFAKTSGKASSTDSSSTLPHGR